MSDLDGWRELRRYLSRIERTFVARAGDDSSPDNVRLALTLAVNAIDDLSSRRGAPPVQIVVLGPTQVGKSTVVNLLLGSEHAVASPLAAYTEHLHGFAQGVEPDQARRMRKILGQGGTLATREPGERNRIVWDTPDFDSHRSHGFRQSIARVAAYADVLVVVVSKEKYADLSVWRMLGLLRHLGRPTVVCLNKVSDSESILRTALAQRVTEAGLDTDAVPICVLPQAPEPVYPFLLTADGTRVLLLAVDDAANRPASGRRQGARNLIAAYWPHWMAPIREEVDAGGEWRRQVRDGIQGVLDDYRVRYLEHAQQYAAFNRAILQLLELLEIPGLSRPLTVVRSALTWPLRKLLGQTDPAEDAVHDKIESDVLRESLEHLLFTLRRRVSETAGRPPAQDPATIDHTTHWWRCMQRGLADWVESAGPGFRRHVEEYQTGFEPEIDAAARSLYRTLQQSPVTLNALRSARMAADAGGVLLAFKTGTVGVTEALLTPAMLSLTSYLTESAVGTYMGSVKRELQEKQFRQVNTLFEDHVVKPLLALPDDMTDPRLFLLRVEELAHLEKLKDSLQ